MALSAPSPREEALAAAADSSACPRCGARLTNPDGLGWCPGCGYCRSLEERAGPSSRCRRPRRRSAVRPGAAEFGEAMKSHAGLGLAAAGRGGRRGGRLRRGRPAAARGMPRPRPVVRRADGAEPGRPDRRPAVGGDARRRRRGRARGQGRDPTRPAVARHLPEPARDAPPGLAGVVPTAGLRRGGRRRLRLLAGAGEGEPAAAHCRGGGGPSFAPDRGQGGRPATAGPAGPPWRTGGRWPSAWSSATRATART